MDGVLDVEVRAHLVNGWFLAVASRPVIVVGETRYGARWRSRVRIPVAPGRHVVGVGIRYRGTSALLGLSPTEVTVGAGAIVRLIARNGPLNSDPFRISARA